MLFENYVDFCFGSTGEVVHAVHIMLSAFFCLDGQLDILAESGGEKEILKGLRSIQIACHAMFRCHFEVRNLR